MHSQRAELLTSKSGSQDLFPCMSHSLVLYPVYLPYLFILQEMSEGQGNRHHTSLHLLARAVQCNFSQRQASREVWGHICWLALCGLLKHFTQLISLLIYTSINFSPFEFVVHGEGQSHVGSPRQLFSHLLVSYQFSFLGTQRFTKVCPHVTPICSSEPQRLWKMATLVPGRPHWLERRLTLVFQTRHNIVYNENAKVQWILCSSQQWLKN